LPFQLVFSFSSSFDTSPVLISSSVYVLMRLSGLAPGLYMETLP